MLLCGWDVGGTARPPEDEWSKGVAAFLGGCYNQDIFKDPKKRHYYDVSVLYNKDIYVQGLRIVAGIHAPGRARQHFDSFYSISDRVKTVTTQHIVYAC